MSKRTEKLERPSREATDRGALRRRDLVAALISAGRPAGRVERDKLRDLLGDYSEQTGAFFG